MIPATARDAHPKRTRSTMYASGMPKPVDPELIMKAIANGAEYHEEHLRLRDGSERWLAVADVPGSGPTDPDRPNPDRQWILTHTKGVRVAYEAYARLAAGELVDGYIRVGLDRWELAAPLPADRAQLAKLVPA